jgi:lipoyl(octanoyl) transferase
VTAERVGLLVRRRGIAGYEPTWRAMQAFTSARDADTPDEIWLTEHPPVYTVGLAGRPQHLPRTASAIPVVHTDRGGQITYHGPGQVVAYTLVDLKRLGLGVREYVRRLESAIIDVLADEGIAAYGKVDAPGVYVRRVEGEAKIAALGLKVRNGCTYHGVAVNVDMDLSPFAAIDPCGYAGLAVTQLRDLGSSSSVGGVGDALAASLARRLAPGPAVASVVAPVVASTATALT